MPPRERGSSPVQPRRPQLFAVSGVLFGAVVVLAGAVQHQAAPLRFDSAVLRALGNKPVPGGSGAGTGGTAFGSRSTVLSAIVDRAPAIAIAFVVAMAGIAAWRSDRWALVLSIAGPVVAVALVDSIAKPLVDRHLGAELSYPSAHASGAAAVVTALSLIVSRRASKRAGLVAATVGAVFAVALGVALVRLGLHYPTDVFGGLALGVAVVLTFGAALPDASSSASPASPPRPGA